MKYKDLITNTDIPNGACSAPIWYASNNSDENHLEYRPVHNCIWEIAYDAGILRNDNPYEFELDCFCVLIRKSGVPDEYNLIFYNYLGTLDYGIEKEGDSLSGYLFMPQIVSIDFEKIDPEVKQIDFLITIQNGKGQSLKLENLTKLRVRIESDRENLNEYKNECEDIFQYDVASFPCECYVAKIGSFVREPEGWIYNPVVEDFDKMDINEVLTQYGFDVVG